MHRPRKSILFVYTLTTLLAFPGVGLSLRTTPTHEQKGNMRQPLKSRQRATSAVVPAGAWGGEHIGLQVSERNSTAEFDCAHADIARKLILDRRGRFSVAGKYFEEHGGPVRASGEHGGYAVRFDGRVEGKTMHLTITRARSKELIGTFTLVHHQEPFIVKCR